jgi:hypothetical protein
MHAQASRSAERKKCFEEEGDDAAGHGFTAGVVAAASRPAKRKEGLEDERHDAPQY